MILSQASAEFKQAFNEATLIFAKGMGYYEALHELPRQGRVFHCLKAKCKPVAKSIVVSTGKLCCHVPLKWSIK